MGDGRTTTAAGEAGKLAGQFYKDRSAHRARAAAGLRVLAEQPTVDGSRLAAIGYCFGGTTCLQLACSGADLKAVVSFHGGLFKPSPEDAKAVKGRVLICNGGADAFISGEDRKALVDAFEAAKVDYQFIDYAGAVHAFTNPDAGSFGLKGVAYDEKADTRSWRLMQDTFKEAFGAGK